MSLGKIAIVGSGAVGLYYGGLLALAGEEVHFLMRADFEAASRGGIRLRDGVKERHLAQPQLHRTTEEIGPCDWVIVAVKATANNHLRTLIPPLLHRSTTLLTLQNGMGNEEFLAAAYGSERVLGGLCFVCLNRTAPAVVENFGHGSITLGEYGRLPVTRTQAFSQAATAAGIHLQVVDSLKKARWRKLVWNIPFNGLTIAAGGVDVQQIIRDPSLRTVAAGLMEEVRTVAHALDHQIDAAYQEEQLEMTRVMGPYRPSSLIDFQQGRPIEIEAIWGEPCRIANNLAIPVPRMEMLYALLKRIDSDRAKRG